ncbi:MAG TPA: hypothetical protein VE913_06460, partial [Longimicrobium sp.]|nr:hypothetical protein [Longimicrobium sp.]
MSNDPKIYNELAPWWPLMSAPQEYEEEAEFYAKMLDDACSPRTVLELGSGGGNNASHLKKKLQHDAGGARAGDARGEPPPEPGV